MTPEISPGTRPGTRPGTSSGISLDNSAVRDMDLAARRRRSQEREAAARAGAGGRTSRLESDFALGLAGAREGSRRDGDGHGEAEGSDADSAADRAAEGDTTVVTARLLEKLGYVRRPCSVCHHSFRLGEEVTVRPAEGGTGWVLRHSSRLLGCESDGSRPAASSRLPADFHRGLAETNPPPPELHVTRLAAGDPLLAVGESPGGATPVRHTCWVCGMTLRQGEVVIRCTCSPENPQCLCAVHRDPDRGLVCYDRWKANYDKIPCLMRNEPRA